MLKNVVFEQNLYQACHGISVSSRFYLFLLAHFETCLDFKDFVSNKPFEVNCGQYCYSDAIRVMSTWYSH